MQAKFILNDFHRAVSALKKKGFRIHDRRIVTTYYCMEAGKGFNIFDCDIVMPCDSRFFFGFHFNGANILYLEYMLKVYTAATSKAIATEVYGSNKNRLLK